MVFIAWNDMRWACYQASLLPGSFYVITIFCFYTSKPEHGDALLQAVGKAYAGLAFVTECLQQVGNQFTVAVSSMLQRPTTSYPEKM